MSSHIEAVVDQKADRAERAFYHLSHTADVLDGEVGLGFWELGQRGSVFWFGEEVQFVSTHPAKAVNTLPIANLNNLQFTA